MDAIFLVDGARYKLCRPNITLNTELKKLPKEVAEYAILHELLHVTVPNHGKTFKALLSAHMPNWEELHNKLAGAK